MNITTTTEGSKLVNRVLRFGRVTRVRAERGQFVDPIVEVQHDTQGYLFEQGRDGVWRFVRTTGWTDSRVYGDACDASGFPVATAAAVRLNGILDAAR